MTDAAKITIRVPETLYEPLSLLCAEKRVTMQGYLSTMLVDAMTTPWMPAEVLSDETQQDAQRMDLRLSESLLEDVALRAIATKRTKSAYILGVLKTALKRHGYT